VKDKAAPTTVIYLHGLGSSPESPKAKLFSEGLEKLGYQFVAPPLSLPNLSRLSAKSAFQRTVEEITSAAQKGNVVIIGSSFGGFLAARSLGAVPENIGQKIIGVVLLAPVVYPWHAQNPIISAEAEAKWRSLGSFPVEEGATGQVVSVHLDFIDELKLLSTLVIDTSKTTLVIHGELDEVVPYSHSVEFVAGHPFAKLIPLDDNHQMMADPRKLLEQVTNFLKLI
jgi:hypothetical protein